MRTDRRAEQLGPGDIGDRTNAGNFAIATLEEDSAADRPRTLPPQTAAA